MGQVNVNYDDRTLAGIDRICSVKGLSRTEVMRLIATEAIEAHDAGRLAFQEVGGPKLGGTLNALAAQLRDNMVEQDRLLRSTQRHEKKMLEAWVASEDAIRTAQEVLVERMNEANLKSYQPFVEQAHLLHTAFSEQSKRLFDVQVDRLKQIEKWLKAVRADAAQPRNLYQVMFPGDFSIGFLTALASVIGLVGAFAFLFAAANMEWLGVPVARKLLPTTGLLCEVIDDRYGVSDCEVPTEYRQGPVRAARAGK